MFTTIKILTGNKFKYHCLFNKCSSSKCFLPKYRFSFFNVTIELTSFLACLRNALLLKWNTPLSVNKRFKQRLQRSHMHLKTMIYKDDPFFFRVYSWTSVTDAICNTNILRTPTFLTLAYNLES